MISDNKNYYIKQFNWEQIEKLYNNQMQEDFPAAEIKPLELLKKLYDKGNNKTLALYREGEEDIKAYAIFEKPDCGEVWLIDYLAVNKNERGNGIGGIFLGSFAYELKDVQAVMAEIESITEALNEEERNIRIRRKHFYLKNGLCETGIFTKADGGVDYEILCLPIRKKLEKEAAAETMKHIYETFFKENEYEIYI